MKILTIVAVVAASLGVVGAAAAQDAPSLRDLERSKASFISVNEEFAEAAWPNMVAPYNRTQAGLGDEFPGKEWNDEDRAVFGCAYDKLVETDQMASFQKFQEMNAAMAKEFGENESITVIELFGVEDDNPLMLTFYEQDEATFEAMADVLNGCGAGDLAMKRMQETDLMNRVFGVIAEQMGQ
ncbi:MAG: hypothetical protein AAFR98_02015 [Pseudomonadota bacterium]